jgi:site-specific recombinase XerD
MSAPLVARYLASLETLAGRCPGTIERHRRILDRWVAHLGQHGHTVVQAWPADLLAFVEQRAHAGAGEATIRGELCVLRTFSAWMERAGLSQGSPAAALPVMICSPVREKAFLTVAECFALLATCDPATPRGRRDATMIALLWSTGLRTRELLALRWRDVDLADEVLLVRRGKGGKQRQLFLNQRVAEDLRQYRVSRGGGEDDPVFCALAGDAPREGRTTALSATRLVGIVRAHAGAAGLDKPVSPMTLRHTFATHMYEAGATLEEIKEMLGHDCETETTVYVHVTLAAVRRLLAEHVANPSRDTGRG